MPVTETIDDFGRRVQGVSCSCCAPSLGHVFGDRLTCACGQTHEAQRRAPVKCEASKIAAAVEAA